MPDTKSWCVKAAQCNLGPYQEWKSIQHHTFPYIVHYTDAHSPLITMIAVPALMNACLLFCLCALLCELVSFCVPGWLIVVFDGPYMKLRRNYAVWYLHECVTNIQHVLIRESHCATAVYSEKLKQKRHRQLMDPEWDYAFTNSEVLRWEIEVAFGALSLLVASLLLIRLRRSNLKAICESGHQEPTDAAFCVPAILTVASGVLYILPIVQMTQANITRAQSIAKEVPYGAILAALGALLSLCSSAIVMCIFFKKRTDSDIGAVMVGGRGEHSAQALPMLPARD